MENIQVGKFYRTRHGHKARVICTDLKGCQFGSIISLVYDPVDDTESIHLHRVDGGAEGKTVEGACDLLEEWIDKPVIDWDKLGVLFRSASMLSNGEWLLFTGVTELAENGWKKAGECISLPAPYAPTYSGPWEQSLVIRP